METITKLNLRAWNAKWPDGSRCFMASDDGKEIETTTKSSAWFSGAVAVVLVKNCSEPYPISRLRMADRNKLPHAKCLSYAPPLHRPDENIEEYARPPERLRTLTDLVNAAEDKKSVHCPDSWSWKNPKPASVVINLSGLIIYRLLNQGIYIYEKPKP